jgi:cytochrome c-type biogenesis protein
MDSNISALTAFLAGILSFVSPCVLPLASSYLFFISGVNTEGLLSEDREKKRLFSKYTLNIGVSTLFFILGFTLVFIAMSVLLYGFIFFLGGVNRIVTIIAGSVVIILGCNILFNFIPFLKYDDTGDRCMTCTPEHSILAAKEGSFLHPSSRPKGHLGSFLVGIAFGAGWTPCVGAFLGSILLMASQSETLGVALVYLAVYSAGLGVPFLITSFFWASVIKWLYTFGKLLPVIKTISGIFLILMGAMMALGRLTALNAFFQKTGYGLSQWAQSGAVSVRLIPGLFFLGLGLTPFLVHIIRKRRIPSLPFCIWSCLFLVLGAVNITGLLNCAAFISQWFSFSGI